MRVVALTCPNCAGTLNSDRTRCDHCGTAVALTRDKTEFVPTGGLCPNCSTENSDDERRCGECGASLRVNCPFPGCGQENNVWRKCCSKCGENIRETRLAVLQIRRDEIAEKLEEHRRELQRIQANLEGSAKRKHAVRIPLGMAIGFLVLAFLFAACGLIAFIGLAVFPFWISVFVAVAFWLRNRMLPEREILLESVAMHVSDIEQLENELQSIKAELESLE